MALVDVTNLVFKNINISNSTLAPEESFILTATIKNNSNYIIGSFKTCLIDLDNADYSASNYYGTDFSMVMIPSGATRSGTVCSGKSLAVNASCDSGSNLYTYMANNTIRSKRIRVRMVFTLLSGNSSTTFTAIVDPTSATYALDKRVYPKIDIFSFKRCDSNGNISEDGEYGLISLKTSFADNSYYHYFYLRIEQRLEDDSLVNSITIDPEDPELLDFVNGITDDNRFINLFGFLRGQSYKMSVRLSDTMEAVTSQYSVPVSFVNVHLSSAKTGGVAFGKYSNAENNNPLFECAYPVELDSTLDVNDDVGVDGDISADGNITSGGNITSTGYISAGTSIAVGTNLGVAIQTSTQKLVVRADNGAGEMTCNAPATFAGICTFKSNIANIVWGTSNSISLNPGASTTISIQYGKTFNTSTPLVMVCPVWTANITGDIAGICYGIHNKTATNFQLTVSNAGLTAASNLQFAWFAYGPLSL